MVNFSGILLISDIDGTLTDKSEKVSEINESKIEYFKANGGRFTIATGRLTHYLEENALNLLVNAPVILYNGGIVYDYKSKFFIAVH